MKNRNILLIAASSAALWFLALLSTFPVMAQQGESPQMALSVAQASPGAKIEVIGGKFEPDIFVQLILFQNGNQIPLDMVVADDHGDFSTAVLLPFDLQVGKYELHAVDEKNRRAITSLMIVPDPNAETGGGQGPREEDDGLLAPMPTNPPAINQSDLSSNSSSPGFPWKPFVAGFIIVVIFLIAVVRRRAVR